MILSRHGTIAGLDLKYAQIRWVTWKYYGLRGESLFCSYSPSATIPSRKALSRDFVMRKRQEFAASYALFAELFDRLPSERGRAGIIVPTGIVSDATTADFFAHLVSKK